MIQASFTGMQWCTRNRKRRCNSVTWGGTQTQIKKKWTWNTKAKLGKSIEHQHPHHHGAKQDHRRNYHCMPFDIPCRRGLLCVLVWLTTERSVPILCCCELHVQLHVHDCKVFKSLQSCTCSWPPSVPLYSCQTSQTCCCTATLTYRCL